MQKQGGSCGNSKRQLRGSYFSSLWGIFMINCWQRGLSPLCGMPSLGEWHWAVGKRKRSTQGRARKQATFSQGLWCACLQPPTSHLTSHTDFPQQGTVMWKRKSNKPLPLQVDCDLYHIKGNLTRTVLGSRKGSSLTDMIMLTFFFLNKPEKLWNFGVKKGVWILLAGCAFKSPKAGAESKTIKTHLARFQKESGAVTATEQGTSLIVFWKKKNVVTL